MLSKKIKNRFGFTLIEVMIVVFIIALLSTAAVGGYTRYRKISLLEIAADNIVSTIYQARDSAKMGKTSGEDSAVCYGVKFKVNGGPFVSKISAGFDAVKKWDKVAGGWVDGLCEEAGGGEAIDLDDLVVINSISGTSDECEILFAPPDGNGSSTCGSDALEIVIAYGEEVDVSYQRIIKFDLKSGIANVEKLSEK
jgi:prepilin-type N-terminal cleavage/methylation domain-containing protein